jgi:PAS domain S-box-containing protein
VFWRYGWVVVAATAGYAARAGFEAWAGEELRESEERLRRLGENLPESAIYQYMHDKDGTPLFCYVSNAIERINGVRAEDVLRDPDVLRRQILPEFVQSFVEAERKSARNLTDFLMDVPMRRPDGAVRWMRMRSRPRRLPDGGTLWDGVQTDITERKQAAARLAEREAQLALFVEYAPAAIAMFDRDMRYIAASRRYLIDYGLPEGTEMTGRSHYDIFPEISERWRTIHARVLAGEPLSQEEEPFPRANGRTDWVSWSMTPWRTAEGDIGGALLFSEVRTEQVEARQALAASGARYRTLFNSIDQGYCIVEVIFGATGKAVDYHFLEVNAAFERHTGLRDVVNRRMRSIYPELEEHWFEVYGEVALTGTPRRFEAAATRLRRYFDVYAFRFGAPAEHKVGILFADITERKQAENRLRESEERQSFLLKLSDAVRPLVNPAEIQGEACRLLAEKLDVDRAYYVEIDEAADTARVERDFVRGDVPSIAGEHRTADFAGAIAILRRGDCHVVGDTQTSELVPPVDRLAFTGLGIIACMGAPLIKEGRLVGALCVTAAPPRVWTDSEIDLLKEVGERMWAAVERARAEWRLRESEEQIKLLLREVNHRAKNLLSVVQTIAAQTAAASDRDEFMSRFSERLRALGANQDLLVRSRWQNIELASLVRAQLAHFGELIDNRISIEGPRAFISAGAAQTIGMALHELATNAAKYGALSGSEGTVEIAWAVHRDGAGKDVFCLSWTERGGPEVRPPTRRGFGTTVIERVPRMKLKADVRLDYAPSGVTWLLSCPPNEVLEPAGIAR